MSLSEEKGKRKRWQFSIRELIAIMLIVALVIGYWQERIRRRQVTDRLDTLLAAPFIVVKQDDAIQKYDIQSSVSFLGMVYLATKGGPLRNPRITGKLLRADTLEVIKEIEVAPNFHSLTGTYSFAGTFKQTASETLGLQPGGYLIRLDCLENGTSVARGLSVFEAVDSRATATSD
jgi:hypothetical protein